MEFIYALFFIFILTWIIWKLFFDDSKKIKTNEFTKEYDFSDEEYDKYTHPKNDTSDQVIIKLNKTISTLELEKNKLNEQIKNKNHSISDLKEKIKILEIYNNQLKEKLINNNDDISDLNKTRNNERDNSAYHKKFLKLKREFAQKYHPDNIHSGGIEKAIRAEIFKEFWTVIADIENEKQI